MISNKFLSGRYSGVMIHKVPLACLFRIASTKSHASGKIKNRSFRILRMGYDVFFDADSESPHMT